MSAAPCWLAAVLLRNPTPVMFADEMLVELKTPHRLILQTIVREVPKSPAGAQLLISVHLDLQIKQDGKHLQIHKTGEPTRPGQEDEE